MGLSYAYIDRYETTDKKEEITDLLVRVEHEFTPKLSVWTWEKGNTIREKMAHYFKPDSSMLLAIDDETNHIAGLFHLGEDDAKGEMIHYSPNLKIETIIVAPPYRGRGVATSMYKEVDRMNQTYFKKPFIVSATWEANDKQHHLYKKNGYELAFVSTYPQDDRLKRYFYVKKA